MDTTTGGCPCTGGLGVADRKAVLLGAVTLPGVERSVATARRFVRDVLGNGHPFLDEVMLGVSELSTNAVTHTPSGEITVRLFAEDRAIRAEVTNDGRTMASTPAPCLDTEAEDGRGILIVEALAETWGVTGYGNTTTVWARFRSAG